MIEAPETAHHAQQHGSGSGHRWFDITMAIAVLLLSVGSLYVALHTGHAMDELVSQNERLVRAQSTPILQYNHGNVDDDGTEALGFEIRNVGTGPARVIWTEIEIEGRTYDDWSEFIASAGSGRYVLSTEPVNRTVLAANDSRRLLWWKRPSDAAMLEHWDTIDKQRFIAKARACYCSVFDQCWTSNMQADLPRLVSSCETARADR